MKISVMVTTLIGTLTLVACNLSLDGPGSDNKSTETKEEDYKYSFNDNGCKTGRHSYDTKEGLCEGLQNNTSNNGCAVDMREHHFVASDCPGDFTPF